MAGTVAHLAVRTATPTLSIDSTSEFEGNGGAHDVAFTVTLAPVSDQTVTVDYQTADETATEGSDYTGTSGTLTFAPGESQKTIPVSVLGDAEAEYDDTYSVKLSNPANAAMGDGWGTGTILNDDRAIRIDPIVFKEGSQGTTEATFRIVMWPTCADLPCADSVTVDYATADGTATASSDYQPASGTVTFTSTTGVETVRVAVRGDAACEEDEVFSIALSNPVNAALITASATATIPDDDCFSVVEFTAREFSVREGEPVAVVSVRRTGSRRRGVGFWYMTSPGSARPGNDFTPARDMLFFEAEEMVKEIQIPIIDDTVAEGTETFALKLSAAYGRTVIGPAGWTHVTVSDDDRPSVEIGQANYSVSERLAYAWLNVAASGFMKEPLTVEYSVEPGTAQEGQDYRAVAGTLTFTPAVRTRTIAVPIVGDTLVEGDETFMVRLSNPSGAAIGSNGEATVTIRDDDLGGVIQLSAVSFRVVEKTPQLLMVVNRTGGLASGVTVSYATSDGTATAGADYAVAAGTLSFAAGQVRQIVAIPIVNDTEAEGWETFRIQLSDATGGATLGLRSSATVTIVDDEPTVELATTGVTVMESAGAVLIVRRTGPLTTRVLVPYATIAGSASPGADYREKSGIITIGPYVATGTIVIPTLRDQQEEPTETFLVTLGAPQGASLGRQSQATVTIANRPATP